MLKRGFKLIGRRAIDKTIQIKKNSAPKQKAYLGLIFQRASSMIGLRIAPDLSIALCTPK